MNARKILYSLFIFLLLAALLPRAARSFSDNDLLEQLQGQTDGTVQIAYHAKTGKVRFIGASPGHPIVLAVLPQGGTTPEQAARQFFAEYGALFGLRDGTQELTTTRTHASPEGRSSVRFQQHYQNVPVFGGELVANLDAAQNILAAAGEILPDLALEIAPTLDAETARQHALKYVAETYSLNADSLIASSPELWIYHPALLGAPGPQFASLVWRVEVTSPAILSIRELVLIEAQRGIVVLRFNQIDAARNRLTYDSQHTGNLPGVLRRSEGQGTYGDLDVDSAHDYAGSVYDFYFTNHNRDSLDNAGMSLISTVHFDDGYTCPNAFWDGNQMVYCDGFPQADDVVAHEMTHGVTDNESSLFYYMQSGAINEALSDIWGELIDQSNGLGNDTPGVEWQVGEDEPNFGAIRSMSNPPSFGQPDKMSSLFYYCGADDQGGVHTNSGLVNKAAYLMVDGGTFNTKTVTALGLTKTAKIFYEWQTALGLSGSDFADLYDGLQQACLDLTFSGVTTPADCAEVKDALDAVEMSQQPANCPATEAPVCPAGQTPFDLFFDDVENPSSGKWTSGALSGDNVWAYPQNPNVTGYDMTYAASGEYNIYGYDQYSKADYYIQMTSNVALPAGQTPYLHFNHAYAFDGTNKDGGVIEYSLNGGNWQDAGSLITENGYDGTLATGNPLEGRQAFVGDSYGYISTRLTLNSLAGQNARFRFRLATNSTLGDWGWYIDDVRVYTCGTLSIADYLPLILRNKVGVVPTPSPTPVVTPTPTTTPPTPVVTPTPTATPPPPITFYAAADTYVMQGYATTNYGSENEMWVGYDDYLSPDGMITRGLIRFDVSTIPAGASISSATLQVYLVGSWDYPDQSRLITTYHPAASWLENSVTWNTAPAPSTSYGSTSVTHGQGGWYSFDVTSLVQGWVNGSIVNNGIMLRGPEVSGNDSSWKSFSTREGSYSPELAVVYGSIK